MQLRENFWSDYLNKLRKKDIVPDFSHINYDFDNFNIDLFKNEEYFKAVFDDFEKNKTYILKKLQSDDVKDESFVLEKDLEDYKKYIVEVNDKVFPTKSKRISKFFEIWKDESLLPDLNRPFKFSKEEFEALVRNKTFMTKKDSGEKFDRYDAFVSIEGDFYLPFYNGSNPEHMKKWNILLKFFFLTMEEYKWISLFRLKKHRRYVIEDFEVTPYAWTSICCAFEDEKIKTFVFIKRLDVPFDPFDPNETYNKYRKFIRDYHDFAFIGWNSKVYDDPIRECILKGGNPFFLNELLIGCQKDWKSYLKITFPESFKQINLNGSISLIPDKKINELSLNFFKFSNPKPYSNLNLTWKDIYIWYFNWFSKKYPDYVKEYSQWVSVNPLTLSKKQIHSFENDFQFAINHENFKYSEFSQPYKKTLGYKNSLWTWDCLQSATLKGDDANESKSLKSFISSLGASILEKRNLFHKRLSKDELVDLTIYNLKDVSFTMYFFVNKLLFNLETDWENKFFSYNYYNEHLDEIIKDPQKFGFKEHMTKKTIWVHPQNPLIKSNYQKKGFIQKEEFKTVADIIVTEKLQETHATWVSKMLTMNTTLSPKQKEDLKNAPYKYKLPEGLKYLADNYLSPEKKDIFYNRIFSKYQFSKEMTLMETFQSLASKSMGFEQFHNLKNSALVWSFGKGGVHSDIKNLIINALVYMADVRGMYPETAAKHGFYPENCNALLYDSIKSRRNDFLKPAGKFLKFLQNPSIDVDNKMRDYLYKTGDEVINKWDFLDFNIFKDVFELVFKLHPEYQNNIFNIPFEKFVNIIKVNRALMKSFAIFTQIKITIYKLINNTWYGTTGDLTNRYIFDLKVSLNITITGQLSLSLLSLMQDEDSIIFNMNTDGIFYHLEDGLSEEEKVEKLKIIKQKHEIWEKYTGYVLEYDNVDKLIQNNVNNYFYLVKDKNENLVLKNGRGGFYKDAFDINNYMTYNNDKISQNTGAAIRIALMREMGLGIPREETFKELIKLKRWDLFQLIVKKGGTFDCLIAVKDKELIELSENTLRVFPVKGGLDVKKYKIRRDDKSDPLDITINNVTYLKGSKVPGMPPSVLIYNDDISNLDSLPLELDLEFYADEVQKIKGKYYDNLLNVFEKSSVLPWLSEITQAGENVMNDFDKILDSWN